jgi:hypothetical protein
LTAGYHIGPTLTKEYSLVVQLNLSCSTLMIAPTNAGLKSVKGPLFFLHWFEILLAETCLQRPVKPAWIKKGSGGGGDGGKGGGGKG